MENLLRERARAAEDAKRVRKKRKKEDQIAYMLNGKKERGKLSAWRKAAYACMGNICLLLLFIYVPLLFSHGSENTNMMILTPDAAAIRNYMTFLKDHPDADFDGDGLPNAKEAEYETDPWKTDTDGDGVSDYAELFITETSPVQASDIMVKEIMKQDEIKGTVLGTPYKIDDVICWPDTYKDKAHGAVIRTFKGYKFCDFNGWVKFPGGKKAYEYRNGIHLELEYRENEEAYRVASGMEIVLYESPLAFLYELKLPFMKERYLQQNYLADILSKILPDQGGYVTCRKMAKKDVDKTEDVIVSANLRQPLFHKEDMSRYADNAADLEDLLMIKNTIERGDCIAVSLYSGNVGEVIGIIYGYTENGAFLVADQNLNPVGELETEICAARIMNEKGNIEQRAWYEWKGLGFDSAKYGDRISCFASTVTIEPDKEMKEETPNNEESQEAIKRPTPSSENTEKKASEDRVITFSLP